MSTLRQTLFVSSFLRWWLFLCLQLMGLAIALYFDAFRLVYEADASKISFLIFGVFVVTTLWVGKLTYYAARNPDTAIGWFVSDALQYLGLIGTVIGFILMLQTLLSDVDTSTPGSMMGTITSMAYGMSTALFTTLLGLVTSLLLKVQLVNLEQILERKREA